MFSAAVVEADGSLGLKGQGRINRLEGALLLASFVAYTAWLVYSVVGG